MITQVAILSSSMAECGSTPFFYVGCLLAFSRKIIEMHLYHLTLDI